MRLAGRFVRLVVVGVGAALAFAGCTSDSPTDPSASPTPLTLAEAQDVVVTRGYLDATVRVTAHPIQVKDGVAVLAVDYELLAAGTVADKVWLAAVQSPSPWDYGPYNLRLLDLEGQQVYQILPTDTGGIASQYTKQGDDRTRTDRLRAGREKATSVSLFVAPQAATVDVLAEPFGVLAAVPVVAGGKDVTDLIDQAGTPGLDGADAFVQPMRLFDSAYDGATVTKEVDQTVTIVVTSDVLFASDDATLSDQATAVLDQAVGQVKAVAADGDVQVVGHTDDVDTVAYNQALSERRADAVKAYLAPRLSGHKIVAEGRGKTEPVAEGTSVEARAANRRVEIVVQRTQTTTQTITSQGLLPEAPPSTGRGLDWVEYTKSNDVTYRVRVNQVVRSGGALVGYLEVGTVAATGPVTTPQLTTLLTPVHNPYRSDTAARGYSMLSDYEGAQQVSLLTADARRYPFDYLEQPYGKGHALWYGAVKLCVVGSTGIGSSSMSAPSPTLLVTVVWPDTGTSTVTVEVPTLFRITDVPVTTDDPAAALNTTYPPSL
ncbi:MAG: OmpA family protein [Micrococcales bacterium]|nr:OmpA family protein [Micrococcales bacterium]